MQFIYQNLEKQHRMCGVLSFAGNAKKEICKKRGFAKIFLIDFF